MRIHIAAARGDLEELAELIRGGADVEARGWFGRTPLIAAAGSEAAGPEIVSTLLAAGADVHATDDGRAGALHRVRGPRGSEKLRVLLDAGAGAGRRQVNDHTALHSVASDADAPARARLLIDRGAPVGTGLLRWHFAQGSHPGVLRLLAERGLGPEEIGASPLHRAIALGTAAEVAAALADGTDPTTADDFDRPPLVLVGLFGEAEMAAALLAAGADPNAPDRWGRTALASATQRGALALVERLLAAGADPETVDHVGESPLSCAARAGHLDVVRALIRSGMDVNFAERCDGRGSVLRSAAGRWRNAAVIRELAAAGAHLDHLDGEGYTPLKEAADLPCLENLAALLDLGASTECAGETALHRAACTDCPRAVRLLLDRGADPDAQDHDGYTALHWSIGDGETAVLDVLLARGADPTLPDDIGESAVFLAVRRHEIEALRRFLAAGADPDAKDLSGTPLLFAAIREGSLEVVDLLIRAGADPRVRDDDGDTALDAAAGGDPAILDSLRARLG